MMGMRFTWGAGIFSRFDSLSNIMLSKGVCVLNTLRTLRYDLNTQHPENGRTLLIEAVCYLRCDLVMHLVDHGVDLTLRTDDGQTAMDFANTRVAGFDDMYRFTCAMLTRALLDRNDWRARAFVNHFRTTQWGLPL